jgi:membrane protein implicated in regulation of membrane protease activity
LDSRIYKKSDILDICFSHLNYGNIIYKTQTNMPWWLAFFIVVPMVIITVILIKVVLKVREKRKMRRQAGYRNL